MNKELSNDLRDLASDQHQNPFASVAMEKAADEIDRLRDLLKTSQGHHTLVPIEGTQLKSFSIGNNEWLLIIEVKGWTYSVTSRDGKGFTFIPFSLGAPPMTPTPEE